MSGAGSPLPTPPIAVGPGFELIQRALRDAAPTKVTLPEGALLNMELSNLAFQERVLELASDPAVPLLEQVRFVSIFGSNLDEFFMTRVAGFKRQLASGHQKRTLDGLRPAEQLELIRSRCDELLRLTHRELLPGLMTQLKEHGVEVVRREELTEADREALSWQYGSNLDTLLTPLAVHPGRPFPHVRNLRPALAVDLIDAHGDGQLAILVLPSDAPMLVPLAGGKRFVPLEEVLRGNLPRLFPESRMIGAHLFRITRSGNLNVRPETSTDLVKAVAANVALRPFEPVVRLEVEEAMPRELQARLLKEFADEAASRSSHLGEADFYRVPGLIDLKRLDRLANLRLPRLRYPAVGRKTPFPRDISVFDRMRQRPVLVRFPRHAFEGTVERLVNEAATDPAVEEIRVTLYRTYRRSAIVRLLRRAHRNGKRVVAFIEVKASFDERRNLEWARSLEAEGIRVLYGWPSLKVHAKIAMVRRREGKDLRIYSYVGTGNLNAATAGAYTDVGLFTADPDIGAELLDIFEVLADQEAAGEYRHLMVAPFNMRERFLGLIDREAEHARSGGEGRITAKLNGVADKQLIAALYAASRAGVRIDLVVRGICSLRPGVAGLSEGIRVVSNAGRYLEHSRIFRFGNGGEPEYFIGSADWRGRNLSRRLEVLVPLLRSAHHRTLDRILEQQLSDPRGWDLQADGVYLRRGGVAPRMADRGDRLNGGAGNRPSGTP